MDFISSIYSILENLYSNDDFDLFIGQALNEIRDITESQFAYIQIRVSEETHPIVKKIGFEDDDLSVISQTIIKKTIESRTPTYSDNASKDSNIAQTKSVSLYRIGPVLCEPIGVYFSTGAIYLQKNNTAPEYSKKTINAIKILCTVLGDHIQKKYSHSIGEDYSDKIKEIKNKLKLKHKENSEQFKLIDGFRGIGKGAYDILSFADLASNNDNSAGVLITGETGTGKGLLAKLIHNNGKYSNNQLIDINCASFPEGLLENELFGHDPYAFSNASPKGKDGWLAQADKTTLFLDEMGEISLSTQVKILKFIEEKQFCRVGGNKFQKVETRIISATNVNLMKAILEKKFREDLFYRLNVLQFEMPSLANRREDISEIIKSMCTKLNGSEKNGPTPSNSLIVFASRASWKGNIRQLQNATESAHIRAKYRNKNQITIEDFFPQEKMLTLESIENQKLSEAVKIFKEQHIAKIIDLCGGDIQEARKKLDVTIQTMKNFGFIPERRK
jgi:transcriptional regulator with PAS, ATPase and Fis domain